MNPDPERLRRWRMVLGGTGGDPADDPTGVELDGDDLAVDDALGQIYGGRSDAADGQRRGADLGRSAPRVARWMGDIRRYFPSTVVEVIQRDAVERLGLTRILLEPELLAAVEPNVHLVSTMLAMRELIPEQSRETARAVIRRVLEDLQRRLADRARSAVTGALNRSGRTNRPKPRDIDWDRTIRANLRHYDPALGTIVPERLVGYPREREGVRREVILAVDQSGSMAESAVYAGLFGAVLASLRTLRTRLVAFDTAVVDLSDHLHDPVDALFGMRLGGGTDINRALAYCQGLVTRPADTLLVLISDLYEGGDRTELLRRVRGLVESGVTMVALLALSDSGLPGYDKDTAAALRGLGVPSFACTPDRFGDLMAAAIRRDDLGQWASANLFDRGLA